jgi:hypothetical protein
MSSRLDLVATECIRDSRATSTKSPPKLLWRSTDRFGPDGDVANGESRDIESTRGDGALANLVSCVNPVSTSQEYFRSRRAGTPTSSAPA